MVERTELSNLSLCRWLFSLSSSSLPFWLFCLTRTPGPSTTGPSPMFLFQSTYTFCLVVLPTQNHFLAPWTESKNFCRPVILEQNFLQYLVFALISLLYSVRAVRYWSHLTMFLLDRIVFDYPSSVAFNFLPHLLAFSFCYPFSSFHCGDSAIHVGTVL